MGEPVITIQAGKYNLGIWMFDTKDHQITIMELVDGELEYLDTLYPQGGADGLLSVALTWLRNKGYTSWTIKISGYNSETTQ